LIRIGNPGRFRETLEAIVKGLAVNVPNPARLTHTLEGLLLQLHEQEGYHNRNQSYHSPAFTDLIDRINDQPEIAWDFAREARRASMSLTHFRRLFRDLAGTSPQQYLIQRRMRRATELLTGTSDPVNQVARDVGFNNEFYFSRLFKRTYALAPIEYRRESIASVRQRPVCS
jgi:transcriptional regulator GlxA family with amidase domain